MNLYILENQQLKITLSDWGASWLSCQVKFPNEQREVLVTTTPARWQEQTAYFGATIGRYANRIAQGRYRLNGRLFSLAQNNGEHNLHGGNIGADKQYWTVDSADQQAVKFSKIFADGEEGFGGEVKASVEYRLQENQLSIIFHAISDQDTPLCLTNHAYFNLSQQPTIAQHFLQIDAEQFLPIDKTGIPQGQFQPVAHTPFDFREPKLLGQDLLKGEEQQNVKGYDHPFLLAKKLSNSTACNAVLSVDDLELQLQTTQPALQVYTGNWLAGQPNLSGGYYLDYAGIALEPESLPDTPNHPEWWSLGGVLRANQSYNEQNIYRFVIKSPTRSQNRHS